MEDQDGSVEDTETGRLFVAVIPPGDVIDGLAAIPRPDVDGVRWTSPERWHVTLRFLGNAPIAETRAALETVESSSVTARLGPDVRRLGKGVAMIPVGGLDDLAAVVAAATADLGQAPAERDFLGHITVARSRLKMPAAALGVELEAEFVVTEINLVRSHLDHVGPRYEVVSARHLGEELD